MPDLKITIKSADVPRVVDAFCARFHYAEMVLEEKSPDELEPIPLGQTEPPGRRHKTIANPQSRLEFTKAEIHRFIAENVTSYEHERTQAELHAKAAAKIKPLELA